MVGRLVACFAALLGAGTPLPAGAAETSCVHAAAPLAAAGVAVAFYPVRASGLREAEETIRSTGPVDPHGVRRTALFTWSLRWRWLSRPDGGPDYRTLGFVRERSVVLPCLTGDSRLSPAERRRWDAFLAANVEHEAAHAALAALGFDRAEAAVRKAAASLPPPSPDEINRAGHEALADLRNEEEKFDADTAHGTSAGRLDLANDAGRKRGPERGNSRQG